MNAGVLTGVVAWRLVVAAGAFTGFFAAVAVLSDPWPALSLVLALLVAGYVPYGIARVKALQWEVAQVAPEVRA